MRKRTTTLLIGTLVAAGAIVGPAAGASVSPAGPSQSGVTGPDPAPAVPSLAFTTKMISYTPVTVAPGSLKPGDGYVLAGRVIEHGKAVGLSTAACTYTIVKIPELRVCTIDYTVGKALLATTGFIDSTNPGAAVTLVVAGGTGAFKDVRGYGELVPTPAGSNVTFYLAK
jgi:hypothetical protein